MKTDRAIERLQDVIFLLLIAIGAAWLVGWIITGICIWFL